GVYLVCGDFKKWLVTLDVLADLLDPTDDRPFRNRFPHLGHHDGRRHSQGSWLWPRASGSLTPQTLQMNRRPVCRMRRFTNGFREGRMCVNGLHKLFHGALEPQREN